jgi:REP element-mobilizing transposase RayT
MKIEGNNSMQKEIAIPLAYFITFTCYGTWLHGGKMTSVDRQHNIPETEFILLNPNREASAKKRLVEAPYSLGHAQRQVVLNTIKEVCAFRTWVLLAAHIRTNHVHLIIHATLSPENIMNTIKAYASRRLNESKLDKDNPSSEFSAFKTEPRASASVTIQ